MRSAPARDGRGNPVLADPLGLVWHAKGHLVPMRSKRMRGSGNYDHTTRRAYILYVPPI